MNTKYDHVMIHALAKSGSMFLYRLFIEISKVMNLDMLSENNTPPDSRLISTLLPLEEVGWLAHQSLIAKENTDNQTQLNKKYIVGPLRYFPSSLNNEYQYIFLLRNPLDILVSEYYSFGWMHPTNDNLVDMRPDIQSMGIDEYCLKYKEGMYGINHLGLYDRYKKILNYVYNQPNNVLILKYEDMVLNFNDWMNKLGNFLKLDNTNIDSLIEIFSSEFTINNPLSHDDVVKLNKKRAKRNLLPNDHMNKLQPATISILNDFFKEIIEL